MTSDSASMPPATPTGPAPTTPFTSPTGPPVQNTPDSGYGDDDDANSTCTVGSIERQVIWENGRSYHKYNAGRYYFPNDETEQDRLDLQNEVFALTFNPERIDAASVKKPIRVLYLSPLSKDAPWVLDVGTGTGLWAINFGDKHSAAVVEGIDLSPIQPRWVPHNVHFIVDDVEKAWSPSKRFNFIHARMMIGALEDWPRFFQNCFEHTSPDGWVEVSGPHLPFGCDDDSLPPTSSINQWSSLMLKASVTLKRPIDIAPKLKEMMHDAGFINIEEKVYMWPINSWPKDEWSKRLGFYTNLNLANGVEGLSMKFFTAGLGWAPCEVKILSAKVMTELKCTEIHAYLNVHVVFGQKPRI